MAFQDEACRWWRRVRLGKVRAPVLVGVACVALLVVGITGFGVAQALSTDGFTVTKGDEVTAEAGASEKVPAEQEIRSEQVCVFVSGEVVRPDVYYLDEGARVADAVMAAGGFTEEASADALNLARTLVDGEQVAVPSQASVEAAAGATVVSSGVTADASAAVASTTPGRININTADAATLQTLNGIGEATAKKIVADREANGPYKTIEDLKRVSGIGDKKFEGLRDSICI